MEIRSDAGAFFDVIKNQDESDGAMGMDWKHITLQVSSYATGSTYNVSVTVLVNGNDVLSGSGSTRFSYEPKHLAVTAMIFAANLPDTYRMTELRVWASRRSGKELEDNRDLHLGLASKRRRQLLRISGLRPAKELFRPLRERHGGPIAFTRLAEVCPPSLDSKLLLGTGGISSGLKGRVETSQVVSDSSSKGLGIQPLAPSSESDSTATLRALGPTSDAINQFSGFASSDPFNQDSVPSTGIDRTDTFAGVMPVTSSSIVTPDASSSLPTVPTLKPQGLLAAPAGRGIRPRRSGMRTPEESSGDKQAP